MGQLVHDAVASSWRVVVRETGLVWDTFHPFIESILKCVKGIHCRISKDDRYGIEEFCSTNTKGVFLQGLDSG